MNPALKQSFIRELRSLVPTRPLTLGESYTLAERQASAALALLDLTQPHVPLDWILDLPKVEVELVPRFRMESWSGATSFTSGRYLILINKHESHARRRFTLTHEFKHLLDYTAAPTLHRKLGYGDTVKQEQQIEAICNHFAACLLMPRAWIKREWMAGIQDVSALAGSFNVSEEAMDKRLRFLGFLDDNTRPLKTYFRLSATPELGIAA